MDTRSAVGALKAVGTSTSVSEPEKAAASVLLVPLLSGTRCHRLSAKAAAAEPGSRTACVPAATAVEVDPSAFSASLLVLLASPTWRALYAGLQTSKVCVSAHVCE